MSYPYDKSKSGNIGAKATVTTSSSSTSNVAAAASSITRTTTTVSSSSPNLRSSTNPSINDKASVRATSIASHVIQDSQAISPNTTTLSHDAIQNISSSDLIASLRKISFANPIADVLNREENKDGQALGKFNLSEVVYSYHLSEIKDQSPKYLKDSLRVLASRNKLYKEIKRSKHWAQAISELIVIPFISDAINDINALKTELISLLGSEFDEWLQSKGSEEHLINRKKLIDKVSKFPSTKRSNIEQKIQAFEVKLNSLKAQLNRLILRIEGQGSIYGTAGELPLTANQWITQKLQIGLFFWESIPAKIKDMHSVDLDKKISAVIEPKTEQLKQISDAHLKWEQFGSYSYDSLTAMAYFQYLLGREISPQTIQQMRGEILLRLRNFKEKGHCVWQLDTIKTLGLNRDKNINEASQNVLMHEGKALFSTLSEQNYQAAVQHEISELQKSRNSSETQGLSLHGQIVGEANSQQSIIGNTVAHLMARVMQTLSNIQPIDYFLKELWSEAQNNSDVGQDFVKFINELLIDFDNLKRSNSLVINASNNLVLIDRLYTLLSNQDALGNINKKANPGLYNILDTLRNKIASAKNNKDQVIKYYLENAERNLYEAFKNKNSNFSEQYQTLHKQITELVQNEEVASEIEFRIHPVNLLLRYLEENSANIYIHNSDNLDQSFYAEIQTRIGLVISSIPGISLTQSQLSQSLNIWLLSLDSSFTQAYYEFLNRFNFDEEQQYALFNIFNDAKKVLLKRHDQKNDPRYQKFITNGIPAIIEFIKQIYDGELLTDTNRIPYGIKDLYFIVSHILTKDADAKNAIAKLIEVLINEYNGETGNRIQIMEFLIDWYEKQLPKNEKNKALIAITKTLQKRNSYLINLVDSLLKLNQEDFSESSIFIEQDRQLYRANKQVAVDLIDKIIDLINKKENKRSINKQMHQILFELAKFAREHGEQKQKEYIFKLFIEHVFYHDESITGVKEVYNQFTRIIGIYVLDQSSDEAKYLYRFLEQQAKLLIGAIQKPSETRIIRKQTSDGKILEEQIEGQTSEEQQLVKNLAGLLNVIAKFANDKVLSDWLKLATELLIRDRCHPSFLNADNYRQQSSRYYENLKSTIGEILGDRPQVKLYLQDFISKTIVNSHQITPLNIKPMESLFAEQLNVQSPVNQAIWNPRAQELADIVNDNSALQEQRRNWLNLYLLSPANFETLEFGQVADMLNFDNELCLNSIFIQVSSGAYNINFNEFENTFGVESVDFVNKLEFYLNSRFYLFHNEKHLQKVMALANYLTNKNSSYAEKLKLPKAKLQTYVGFLKVAENIRTKKIPTLQDLKGIINFQFGSDPLKLKEDANFMEACRIVILNSFDHLLHHEIILTEQELQSINELLVNFQDLLKLDSSNNGANSDKKILKSDELVIFIKSNIEQKRELKNISPKDFLAKLKDWKTNLPEEVPSSVIFSFFAMNGVSLQQSSCSEDNTNSATSSASNRTITGSVSKLFANFKRSKTSSTSSIDLPSLVQGLEQSEKEQFLKEIILIKVAVVQSKNENILYVLLNEVLAALTRFLADSADLNREQNWKSINCYNEGLILFRKIDSNSPELLRRYLVKYSEILNSIQFFANSNAEAWERFLSPLANRANCENGWEIIRQCPFSDSVQNDLREAFIKSAIQNYKTQKDPILLNWILNRLEHNPAHFFDTSKDKTWEQLLDFLIESNSHVIGWNIIVQNSLSEDVKSTLKTAFMQKLIEKYNTTKDGIILRSIFAILENNKMQFFDTNKSSIWKQLLKVFIENNNYEIGWNIINDGSLTDENKNNLKDAFIQELIEKYNNCRTGNIDLLFFIYDLLKNEKKDTNFSKRFIGLIVALRADLKMLCKKLKDKKEVLDTEDVDKLHVLHEMYNDICLKNDYKLTNRELERIEEYRPDFIKMFSENKNLEIVTKDLEYSCVNSCVRKILEQHSPDQEVLRKLIGILDKQQLKSLFETYQFNPNIHYLLYVMRDRDVALELDPKALKANINSELKKTSSNIVMLNYLFHLLISSRTVVDRNELAIGIFIKGDNSLKQTIIANYITKISEAIDNKNPNSLNISDMLILLEKFIALYEFLRLGQPKVMSLNYNTDFYRNFGSKLSNIKRRLDINLYNTWAERLGLPCITNMQPSISSFNPVQKTKNVQQNRISTDIAIRYSEYLARVLNNRSSNTQLAAAVRSLGYRTENIERNRIKVTVAGDNNFALYIELAKLKSVGLKLSGKSKPGLDDAVSFMGQVKNHLSEPDSYFAKMAEKLVQLKSNLLNTRLSFFRYKKTIRAIDDLLANMFQNRSEIQNINLAQFENLFKYLKRAEPELANELRKQYSFASTYLLRWQYIDQIGSINSQITSANQNSLLTTLSENMVFINEHPFLVDLMLEKVHNISKDALNLELLYCSLLFPHFKAEEKQDKNMIWSLEVFEQKFVSYDSKNLEQMTKFIQWLYMMHPKYHKKLNEYLKTYIISNLQTLDLEFLYSVYSPYMMTENNIIEDINWLLRIFELKFSPFDPKNLEQINKFIGWLYEKYPNHHEKLNQSFKVTFKSYLKAINSFQDINSLTTIEVPKCLVGETRNKFIQANKALIDARTYELNSEENVLIFNCALDRENIERFLSILLRHLLTVNNDRINKIFCEHKVSVIHDHEVIDIDFHETKKQVIKEYLDGLLLKAKPEELLELIRSVKQDSCLKNILDKAQLQEIDEKIFPSYIDNAINRLVMGLFNNVDKSLNVEELAKEFKVLGELIETRWGTNFTTKRKLPIIFNPIVGEFVKKLLTDPNYKINRTFLAKQIHPLAKILCSYGLISFNYYLLINHLFLEQKKGEISLSSFPSKLEEKAGELDSYLTSGNRYNNDFFLERLIKMSPLIAILDEQKLKVLSASLILNKHHSAIQIVLERALLEYLQNYDQMLKNADFFIDFQNLLQSIKVFDCKGLWKTSAILKAITDFRHKVTGSNPNSLEAKMQFFLENSISADYVLTPGSSSSFFPDNSTKSDQQKDQTTRITDTRSQDYSASVPSAASSLSRIGSVSSNSRSASTLSSPIINLAEVLNLDVDWAEENSQHRKHFTSDSAPLTPSISAMGRGKS